MILNREQILAANDLAKTVVKVPVPEWGEGAEVYVREFSGREFDLHNELLMKQDTTNMQVRVARQVICDANGKSLFTEADIEALGAKHWAPINRIVAAVLGWSDKKKGK